MVHKLSRFLLWGGVFAATITLAIGASLLAVRVRAAVDARRNSAGLDILASPLSNDLVIQAAAVPALDAGQPPCVSDENVCEAPWSIEPAGSSAAAQAADPAPAQPPQTVGPCCGAANALPPTNEQARPAE